MEMPTAETKSPSVNVIARKNLTALLGPDFIVIKQSHTIFRGSNEAIFDSSVPGIQRDDRKLDRI